MEYPDTVHAPDIVLLNNIQGYYVPDINIVYRRIHSLKFRGIHQELSEIQHFEDKVFIDNNSKHVLNIGTLGADLLKFNLM